jgi:predicted SAM-dependent methyltransferase
MHQLEKLKNAKGKIWLNVASSVYVLEDFINLDNHLFIRFVNNYTIAKKVLPSKYHDLLDAYHEASKKAKLLKHDCRKPLELPDASVDHILCSHFLEHVFPEDRTNILNDFMRVLKPGGTLHIILPDLEDQIRKYLNRKAQNLPDAADDFVAETLLSKESKGSVRYRLMEFGGGFGLQHRWMYDHASISNIVTKMGFQIIEKTEETPSYSFRLNDDSVHVLCRKKDN